MTNGQCAQLACVWEALAPKAGNVHPQAAFDDATWLDFVTSAIVCAPIFDRADELGIGETILQCVTATRDAVGMNTNLGIILLIAPLCCSDRATTHDDAAKVYEAIAIAKPGGLGDAPQGDVAAAPPVGMTLRDAMALAADRDAIARQYVNNFADVTGRLAPRMVELLEAGHALDNAIVRVHLEQMAYEPDTLIARKCGPATAVESQRQARAVLEESLDFAAFDAWLRDDGHRRNPGTSADLIAAGLFVLLRDGAIDPYQKWAGPLSSSE
jgi:triphosphoribosyl-dephospho-CoA synthase